MLVTWRWTVCSLTTSRLALGRIRATQRGQAGGERDPRQGRLERCAAPLEAIDGVLQQCPSTVVVASCGLQHALGQIDGGSQRRRIDQSLDLAQWRESRARLIKLAARDPGTDQQLEGGGAIQHAVRGHLAQQPLEQLDSPERIALIEG